MRFLGQTIRSTSLLLAGFVLGTLGIGAYTGNMGTMLAPTFIDAQKNELAQANLCTPNADEDDIFFLSCGGIY